MAPNHARHGACNQPRPMVIDATQDSWTEARSCQLDGIRVSETVVAAGAEISDHSHPTGQICFLLEGEMFERQGGRLDHLRPGTLRARAPGFRHQVTIFPESDVLALLLFIDGDRWIRTTSTRPAVAHGPLRNYSSQIRRELRHADDVSRAALEGWTMLMVSTVARRAGDPTLVPPAWFKEAVSVIERQATEGISLKTLAGRLGVHRATLAAAFRRYRQTSVGESIRTIRVRQVMRALVETRTPLCEIAVESGFHDQAHMGRIFRRMVGLTPGAYRQLRR